MVTVRTMRIGMAVLAALAATTTACAPITTGGQPQASQPVAEAPTTGSAPMTRADIPVNCLNVVTPAYREALAAMGLALDGVHQQIGIGRLFAGWPVDMRRSVECRFDSTELITNGEFDEADRAALIAFHVQVGGTVAAPSGTIDDAVVILAQGSDVDGTIVTIGHDWVLSVTTTTGITDVALAVPDAGITAVEFDAAVPATQLCESMLPVRNPDVDWGEQYEIGSASAGVDGQVGTCHDYTACGGDVCGPDPSSTPAPWWESAEPAAVEALLADAAAGQDGLSIGGPTFDGTGTVVMTGDVEVLAVFDDAIVHVTVPAGMESSVQLARHVHSPGWLDLPPVH